MIPKKACPGLDPGWVSDRHNDREEVVFGKRPAPAKAQVMVNQ